MPAKIDETVLTVRDAEIYKAHIVDKHTLEETAQIVGVSRDTVKLTKKKTAFRELQIAAIADNSFGHDEWAKIMIDLARAKKGINVGGELVKVDDNVSRLGACRDLGNVWGINAAQKHDISHTMEQMSDAELDEGIDESIQNLEKGK